MNYEDLKIVGWTDFDSSYPHIVLTREAMPIIISIIRDEILRNGYVFSGSDHQNAFTGVPVFSNGTVFRASMRTWGQLMASAYSDDDNEYQYMDFYMSIPTTRSLPEDEYFEVEENEDAKKVIYHGCMMQQDTELISQSLQMGMPLMTTDKVVEAWYDYFKANMK